ncbi:MAG: hypothetical protein NWP69_01845, partial [Congregibacter sp.]|nr:hypothetical protein [Congregibacter sp.]
MAFSPASLAQANTVTVPLRIDYPLLQQLMIMQMFTGTGASRELLNDPSGCSEIFLREPLLASTESKLELLANLSARIGVGAKGSCATMLSWEGRIGISGSPEIRNDGTALGFAPERVWLMDPGGQPLVNNQLQALADSSVRAIFSRFTVDLVPQLQSIGDFLPAVLPRHSQAQIAALISTLRVSNLQAADDALHVDIDFTVEPLTASLPPEHALSDEEIARWEERWQLMDSLLVLAVKHYAASTQLLSLRDALLEVLIESRYRLQDALAETPQSSGDQDLVREWFLQSWQALAPVIRTIGVEQPGQEHLLLISVIAATDALTALDQLGPSVGLDISADGLRRLARMINGSAGDDLLQYSEDLDPQLRKLLDDSFDGVSPPSAWHWDFSFFPKAV